MAIDVALTGKAAVVTGASRRYRSCHRRAAGKRRANAYLCGRTTEATLGLDVREVVVRPAAQLQL